MHKNRTFVVTLLMHAILVSMNAAFENKSNIHMHVIISIFYLCVYHQYCS